MNVPIQVGNRATITSGILLLIRSSPAGLGRSATEQMFSRGFEMEKFLLHHVISLAMCKTWCWL